MLKWLCAYPYLHLYICIHECLFKQCVLTYSKHICVSFNLMQFIPVYVCVCTGVRAYLNRYKESLLWIYLLLSLFWFLMCVQLIQQDQGRVTGTSGAFLLIQPVPQHKHTHTHRTRTHTPAHWWLTWTALSRGPRALGIRLHCSKKSEKHLGPFKPHTLCIEVSKASYTSTWQYGQ